MQDEVGVDAGDDVVDHDAGGAFELLELVRGKGFDGIEDAEHQEADEHEFEVVGDK